MALLLRLLLLHDAHVDVMYHRRVSIVAARVPAVSAVNQSISFNQSVYPIAGQQNHADETVYKTTITGNRPSYYFYLFTHLDSRKRYPN